MQSANWIEALDEHGYNFLIDELVYHLRQGFVVKSVDKVIDGEEIGFRYHFEDGGQSFLNVHPEAINAAWDESRKITARFKELSEMKYRG